MPSWQFLPSKECRYAVHRQLNRLSKHVREYSHGIFRCQRFLNWMFDADRHCFFQRHLDALERQKGPINLAALWGISGEGDPKAPATSWVLSTQVLRKGVQTSVVIEKSA